MSAINLVNMSLYKRFTKAQLRQLCEQRGIDANDCKTKAQLIEAIEQNDLRNDVVIDDNDDGIEYPSVGEQNDVEHVSDDEEASGAGLSRAGESKADEIVALRLRLELAREERKAREREWEIEKERFELRNTVRGRDQQARGMPDLKEIKAILPNFCDSDALTFFVSFERILELNEIDRSLWSKLVPGQLSARALKIFSRLSLQETKSYETVKNPILNGFKLDDAAYLKMFRKMRRTGQNTYKMHLTNLKEVMYRYFEAKGADTFDKLAELFLFEQFTQSLNDNVRQFVESKQPKSSDEAAEFADLSYQISRIGKESNKSSALSQSNGFGSKSCPDKFGGAPGAKQFGTQPPKQSSQAGDGNANAKSFRQQQSNGQFGKQYSSKPKAGNSEKEDILPILEMEVLL